MALKIESPRSFHEPILGSTKQPMADDTILYEGASLGISTGGYVSDYDASTYPVWIGFARETVDNRDSAARGGTSVDGGKSIQTINEGTVEVDVVDSSIATISDAVYAVNDGVTFTTASGTDQVGHIVKWISGTKCLVRFAGHAHP